MKLRVIVQSAQAITCELLIPGQPSFIYTAIYASNLSDEKNDLWVELMQLHASFGLEDSPWMIGGDFNQVLFGSEHVTASENINYTQMYQFRDCLHQMGVCDLRYTGTHLTWTNKQDDYPVAKKLDRQLINSPLSSVFPHAMSSFLLPLFSDHCPCSTDLAFPLPRAGTHPFRFLNYLTKHPNFTEVVSDAWFQAGNEAITLTSLCWKLKNIKNSLKTLNRENYSNLQERVSEANRLLQIA